MTRWSTPKMPDEGNETQTSVHETVARARDGTEWSPSQPGFYLSVTATVALSEIVVLAAYGWASQGVNGWEITALAFLIGAASFWLAGLLGYLFGIPRSLQEGGGPFRANTSLEQISDWLTKIVIGVGLVELRAFGGWINDIGEDVATATDLEGAWQLFVALILLEAGCGFIFFYIWSRVHMPKLFLLAETESEHQARLRDEQARLREELAEARREAERGRLLAEAVRARAAPDEHPRSTS
jgi:hypothetical protein